MKFKEEAAKVYKNISSFRSFLSKQKSRVKSRVKINFRKLVNVFVEKFNWKCNKFGEV